MSGGAWFATGAAASVVCAATLWWTVRSLPAGGSLRAVWWVWGVALLRIVLITSVLWFAVRQAAAMAVWATVGFLLARFAATAWFSSRLAGGGRPSGASG